MIKLVQSLIVIALFIHLLEPAGLAYPENSKPNTFNLLNICCLTWLGKLDWAVPIIVFIV